ncbi:MAG TPA: hypothetical protein VH437_15525 [Terriglobales bacterium]|jgi:hypothetical protein
MSPELKRRIQLVLIAAIALAALRSGYILYQRHSEKLAEKAKQNVPLNADYYITPKKLYPYDLKSARQLTQQPVWVKEGYRYTYYPYTSGHLDLSHPAGLFLPIEKVQFKDVVLAPSPAAHEKLMVALFEKDQQMFGVQIGSVAGDSYQIYSDEQFYIQDPRELYKHWPSDVWDAIEQHQMKAGMSEMQANFAIGMGVPERSDDPATKTVNYPNGGNPLVVTYHDGRAADIKPGHPQG